MNNIVKNIKNGITFFYCILTIFSCVVLCAFLLIINSFKTKDKLTLTLCINIGEKYKIKLGVKKDCTRLRVHKYIQ